MCLLLHAACCYLLPLPLLWVPLGATNHTKYGWQVAQEGWCPGTDQEWAPKENFKCAEP